MKLNRTVWLKTGGIGLCEYDTEDLSLASLWNTIFAASLALNAFALVGNLIVVLACFFQKHRPPLIIYIHALAFSDLLYAIVAPFYTYRYHYSLIIRLSSLSNIYHYHIICHANYSLSIFPFDCYCYANVFGCRYALQYWTSITVNFALVARLARLTTILGNMFSSISCWLVVALTVDRLILTRFPFKASRWSTPKRTHWSIFLIILLCSAFNGVLAYEFYETPVSINECYGYWSIPNEVIRDDNSTYTPLRYKSSYRPYILTSNILILYALPTITMLTANVLIMISFRKNKFSTVSENPRMSRKKAAEIRLTKMISVVSIIFIICNIPDIVTRILWKFKSPIFMSNIQPIAHLSLMCNVGANFIVYALFNRHLFDTMLTWARRCCFVRGSVAIQSSSTNNSQQ